MLFGAPHHIMDENLHPVWLYNGGASPETMYCSAAQEALLLSLKIFLVLLTPLDKISANYHADTNEAFDLGWVGFDP